MKFLTVALLFGVGLVIASPSGCVSVSHRAESGARSVPAATARNTVIEAHFTGDTLVIHASVTAGNCGERQLTGRDGSRLQTERLGLQERCSTPAEGAVVSVALVPRSSGPIILELGRLDAQGVGGFSAPDDEKGAEFRRALSAEPCDAMQVTAGGGYVMVDPTPWRTVLAERGWLKAQEIGSISGFEWYLDSHPGSEHEEAAKRRLASLYAESVLVSEDVDELERFAARFAGTPEARRARERAASIQYAKLQQASTPRQLMAFASRYSELPVAEKAKALAERRAWGRARNSSDPEPLEDYLEFFPESRRGARLRVRLEKIRAQRERERTCRSQGSRCGCSRYRKYECGGACCRWYVGYGCDCR